MVALSDFAVAFEMATGSTPRTATPSYTALTTYVMAGDGITLSRGRQSEQDATAAPGRASVSLRNTDNRFTMGNGSSPYVPLQLRRPCRFRVTYSATTYDLWQGFVDDWGNGRRELTGVARLSLSDRLARAEKAKLPALALATIQASDPVVFYPLNDPAGSISAVGYSATAPTLSIASQDAGGGSVSFGTTAPIGPDPTTGVSITSANLVDGSYLTSGANLPTGLTTTDGALEIYVRVPPGMGTGANIVRLAGTSRAVYIGVGTLGLPYAQIVAGTTGITSSTVPIDDGDWHHISIWWATAATTTTLTLLVDGVTVDTGTCTASAQALTKLNIGATGVAAGGASTGTYAMVAAYATNIGSTALANHAAALTSWSPETTAARFNRLCGLAGVPAAFYATTGTHDVLMGPQPTSDKSLRDAANECAVAAGGTAYVSDTGVLTLAASSTRYNLAVGVTVDATKAGQVDPDTEFLTNDQDLINDSSATRSGGSTFRSYDATSVDAYDTHDESATLFVYLDSQALNWTQWRVAQFKNPAQRLNEVPVNVVGYANSGGTVANLLNADIGTKLRLTNLPADVVSTGTLDLMVEGIRDEIGKDSWVRTFTTSPLGLNDSWWTLGTDAIDLTAVLGY